MGYILPITLYEYINYQNRLTKDKQVSHHIDALYKVILEAQQNNNINVYDRKKMDTNQIEDTKGLKKSNIAITGKGGYFDMEV